MNTEEKTQLKKNKGNKFKIGGLLAAVFLIVYIPSLFNWVFGNNINTDIIYPGSVEDSINTEACIIRDEEAITSPKSGVCIANAREGERVPAGFKIATIVSDDSTELYKKLADLDTRITSAQKEKTQGDELFTEDIKKIDTAISEKIGELVEACNNNSLEGTDDLKRGIDRLILQKSSIVGGKSASSRHIDSLKQEKDSLQLQISSKTRDVYSTYPGIISYSVDGFESSLGPEAIGTLTLQQLEDIKTALKSRNKRNLNVDAGKPFAKIVKATEDCMAAVLDTNKSDRFILNENVYVRINDIGRTVKASIIHISEEDGGKKVLTLKTGSVTGEAAGLRIVNIDIIKGFECSNAKNYLNKTEDEIHDRYYNDIENCYVGMKVPLKSLIDVDNEKMRAKIMLKKAHYASEREVVIIGKNSEYAVIESMDSIQMPVRIYDTFVIDPKNIKDGQMIN